MGDTSTSLEKPEKTEKLVLDSSRKRVAEELLSYGKSIKKYP
jgi:hypothetical protein